MRLVILALVVGTLTQEAYGQLYRVESSQSLFAIRVSSGVAAPAIEEPAGPMLSIEHRMGYSGVLGFDWFLTPAIGFYIEGAYSRNGVDVEVLGASVSQIGIDDITYSSRAAHIGFTLQSGIRPLVYVSVGGGIGNLKASLDVGGPEGNITASDAENGFSLMVAAGAKFMVSDRMYLSGEMRWQRIWVGDEDGAAYRLVPILAGVGVLI